MPTDPNVEAVPPARRGRPPSGGRDAIVKAALELLRERGASRLTTREVASRAGVSEGSVFYHFKDRPGLLQAVIADGLRSLRPLADDLPGAPVASSVRDFAGGLERFLDEALVALIAAQSDEELRAGLRSFLAANDMGPHRGVAALGAFLRARQREGTIRDDVDPDAVAFLVIGACFLRVCQHQMIGPGYGAGLPDLDHVVATVVDLLATREPT
jgi:AcrR family transcriptional regulator